MAANKKITLNIRILKTVKTSTDRVLQLEGGASYLKAFIEQYVSEIQKFKAPGMQAAVVLIVDNDSGADEIYNTMRKLAKIKAPRSDAYVHVARNLYVVPTPLNAGATKSAIEDCFTDEIKNLKLGGKTFNANSNEDTVAYFGKHILSVYIRENASKVDFTGSRGFSIALLQRSKRIKRNRLPREQPALRLPNLKVLPKGQLKENVIDLLSRPRVQ